MHLGVLYLETKSGEKNIAKLKMLKGGRRGKVCLIYYTAAGELGLEVSKEVVEKHILHDKDKRSVQDKDDIEKRLIKHGYAKDITEARHLMSQPGTNSHLLLYVFLRELEALDKRCHRAKQFGEAYEEWLNSEDFEGLNEKHAPDVMDRMMWNLKKLAHGTMKGAAIECVKRVYDRYRDLLKDQQILPNRWIYYHMMDFQADLVTIQQMRDEMGEHADPKEMLSLAVKWVGTHPPVYRTPRAMVEELEKAAADFGVPEARGKWLPDDAKGCEALSLVLNACETSSDFEHFLSLVDDEWAAPKEQLGFSYKFAYSKIIDTWKPGQPLSSWQSVCDRLSKIVDKAAPLPLMLKAARIHAHHLVGLKDKTCTIKELLDELGDIEDKEERISAAAEVVKMIKGTWPPSRQMVDDMQLVFVKAVPEGIPKLKRNDSYVEVDVVHDIQTTKMDTPLLFFLALIDALDRIRREDPPKPVHVVTGRGKHATRQGKEFRAPDEIRRFLKSAHVKFREVDGNDGMLNLDDVPSSLMIKDLEKAIRSWRAGWNGMNDRSKQPARDWTELLSTRRN